MKFTKYIPSKQLRPYIKYFVVSEDEKENTYKVLPSSGLVIGFQYKGQLSAIDNNIEIKLQPAGITGIIDSYRTFKNEAAIGTVLVYFTEIGFTHFISHPAHELFNLSISLEDIYVQSKVTKIKEQLSDASGDPMRVKIVEEFLLSEIKHTQPDKLIEEAVRQICKSNGTIRIKELNEKLFISQSPFEKRFRAVVGTTPKKFASIVRFNSVLNRLRESTSLISICYDNDFFDQAHFIRDFKQFTGQTPQDFRRFL